MEICCGFCYNYIYNTGGNGSMLGKYEKRYFADGEKVWIGHYRNLTNVLHWHFECELIRIVSGKARIRIGEHLFDATEGQSFFCVGGELHYIISESQTRVDVLIFDENTAKDITGKYVPAIPVIGDGIRAEEKIAKLEELLKEKGMFYREALQSNARSLILDIFRSCELRKKETQPDSFKQLIHRLREELADITFEDAVRYSGYSASHFSRNFRQWSGMNFTDYMNIVRIENSVFLMRTHPELTMTEISVKSGFSTVRNFNRVFREITGYSPRTLPAEYNLDIGLRTTNQQIFDPTQENSELI